MISAGPSTVKVMRYLERDVRMSIKVQDLSTFQRFLQLCAGRVGQLVNLSSLASDTGINMGNKPVNDANWYDAARFTNWMV